MDSETDVDVPAVQDAARELSRSTGDFKQAVDDLRAELNRDQGCWSDDELGKGFEQKYGEADQVKENLTKLGDSLEQFATEGLPKAVENLQQLDSQFGEEIQKFADQIGDYKPSSGRSGGDSS